MPDTSTAPLRVLQVTPRMAPSVGGVETHVREIARRMRQHQVETRILTVDATGRLPPRDELDGVPLDRVRAWPTDRDWLCAPGLPKRIREGRWDVVHVQSYHTFVAPLAMAAAARARIPYVVTFHGGGHSSWLRTRIRGSQIKALGPLLRRAAALVCIANFEIEHYGRQIGVARHRFVTIPNGADLPEAAPVPDPDGPLIVSSGRLERYKGHHRVLAAFAHVLEDVPDAHLWLAGAGPCEDELRRQATQLGVADRVEISVAERAVMAGRLGKASLAVLLSDFESHPLAALEALALGVPLVVADNSGLAEIAEQGLALAVAADAPPDTHAAAMLTQLRTPLRIPDLAIPTWDECAGRLAGLYRLVSRDGEVPGAAEPGTG